MTANMGRVDKLIRIVLGLALIGWAAVGGGPVWAWIGIVPLATALINFCPLYRLLGISTLRKTGPRR